MDSTDISTSGKNKAFVSINSIEAYNKETLSDKIRRLTTANVQLMADKTETEKARVNLKADKVRLFGKKNSLVVKKEELRIEIIVLNTAGFSNILIRGHQDPFLRPT